MRIVIDLRIFGPQPGGLGRYNQKFLEELMRLDNKNEYILIFKEDPHIDLPHNFRLQICNCHWYSFKEQLTMPFILRKFKPDLVHFPHFNVPIFYRGRFIVTIHDLIMTKFPSQRATTLNPLFFSLKYRFYQKVINYAIDKAEKIITVSKFTADDIRNYFTLTDQQSAKLQVVYEGVTVPEPGDNKKLFLPAKFLLYVGNAYPHKNLEMLVASFKDFMATEKDYYLILVGQRNYFYERLKKETIKLLGENSDRVIFTGYIPDEQLAHYYQQAMAYVFPSVYEGFGLPPLEAMAYGLPVLSSNSSCLPEILGEAALYFDFRKGSDLLDKMKQIINNNQLRHNLIVKGKEQIQKYSWSKMTRELIDIYKQYQ